LTAAKPAAKTIASYRHGSTGLEYRPSRRTQLDGSGRSAQAYGCCSDARRPHWASGVQRCIYDDRPPILPVTDAHV
jgi:hypothetical protein